MVARARVEPMTLRTRR